jgi:dTDP-4-dehydrorhamnose 3,5-epimerase
MHPSPPKRAIKRRNQQLAMKTKNTGIDGVVLIEPDVFSDARGFLKEAFNQAEYDRAGVPASFVQDNHSHSRRGTLRGLHYQLPRPQGKLVFVIQGEVFDVAVDLRSDSATFGRWFGVYLNANNHLQLYLPPGIAHGFYVTSESADVIYKCTDFYQPTCEHTIAWNDPQLKIAWPTSDPIVSPRDRAGLSFADAPRF